MRHFIAASTLALAVSGAANAQEERFINIGTG